MEFILIFIAFAIFAFILYRAFSFNPTNLSQFNQQKLFIYGHRGVPSLMPENTLTSFQKAFELDVDGIELDIQITKDNIVVVHHDPHLERLTGIQSQISSLAYEDVKKIDARGDGFTNVEPQYIPTLEEVLKIIPKNKLVNIEIKSQKLFSEGMEAPTVKLIEKYDLAERVVISSFNPLNPQIPIAQLWDKDEPYSSYYWIFISKPSFLHTNIDQLNVAFIGKIKKLKLPLLAYTVNSKKQLEKAKSLNLNGIFTDNPQYFSDV